ncbi:MAG: restriction endonuclease subunit S [Candidatus Bathyarchaeia archaeon]
MNKIEFYKETNFKQTPIGEFPFDWQVVKLKDICIQITDGTHKTPTYVDEGIPFISTQNIVPFRKGFDFSEYKKYISSEEHRELIKRCKPEKGDILISKCGTIGRTKLVDVDYEFSIFVGVALLKLKKDLVSGEYLEQLLNYDPMRVRMEISSPGSTRKTLTINAIENLHIPLPKLEEQYRIAEVLSVVDLAVQRTDMVIAKTERLKKGLMQTLLTRGIGHKEFKDTEIGKIPKTWRVATLGEIAKINKEQIDPTKSMPDKTFIYIDIDSVENETGKIRNPKKILGRNAPSRARRVVHENDVIMSTVRPYLKAFAIIPKEYDDQICSTGFAVLSCKKDIVIPYFLLIALFSENVIKQCNQMMMGGQYPALNQSQVSRIKIPLPSCDEQEKIASIFYALDEKLELERIEKKRLEMIKKGLMDLLLTGKVRVKVN